MMTHQDPLGSDLNPAVCGTLASKVNVGISCGQAVTRNELYGYLHPATREWKEGIISATFRDMAENKTNKHQWIVLDGDIDAEWIEVLHSYHALSSPKSQISPAFQAECHIRA